MILNHLLYREKGMKTEDFQIDNIKVVYFLGNNINKANLNGRQIH